MGKIDWNKAKKKRPSLSIQDEFSGLKTDMAGRYLSGQAPREERRHTAPDRRPRTVIYTDGACVPNPGSGGWAFVVYFEGEEIFFDKGGDRSSTNNRMEIIAVLSAIKWLASNPKHQPATILSDSQYVVKGCVSWRHKWKRNGWLKQDKAEVSNLDLWKGIDVNSVGVSMNIEWVKGHAGILGNERADRLSVEARKAFRKKG